MRYELRFGKFGPYFHDFEKQRDLGLYEVLLLLNSAEDDGHLAPTNHNFRESIAKQYHEICREMVNNQIGMITKLTQPYIEWKDLSDEQRDGRRFVAENIIRSMMGLKYPNNEEYWANWQANHHKKEGG